MCRQPWKKKFLVFCPYVVPFTVNERLPLVWPEFRETPEEPPDAVNVPPLNDKSTPMPVSKPDKGIDVSLSVTERRHDRWTHKRIAESPIFVWSEKNYGYPTFLADESHFSACCWLTSVTGHSRSRLPAQMAGKGCSLIRPRQ